MISHTEYCSWLIGRQQTANCGQRVERHLPSASVLGHDGGMFSLLTLCVLSMQPSRFCPLLPPLCWLYSTPHPTHYFSAYQGPLIPEVVSVMVLLASSKCLETFSLVVKHCILTKWPFCDLLVVLKFHRWKVQWLHGFHY